MENGRHVFQGAGVGDCTVFRDCRCRKSVPAIALEKPGISTNCYCLILSAPVVEATKSTIQASSLSNWPGTHPGTPRSGGDGVWKVKHSLKRKLYFSGRTERKPAPGQKPARQQGHRPREGAGVVSTTCCIGWVALVSTTCGRDCVKTRPTNSVKKFLARI
jgi:hypothetical protein